MTTTITTITAELAASIRQYPLAVGTEVTFLPTRADYDGRDASTGTVTERVTERDASTAGLYSYVIACPGGASAVRNGFLADDEGRLIAGVVPTALLQPAPGDAPAPDATPVLPRVAEDARRIAAFLADGDPIAEHLATLVRFLPGGEVEAMGRKLSEDRSLCSVYDRTVVPAMGYEVRSHCAGEVPDHLARQFAETIDAIERDAESPRAGIATMADRYSRGGVVNQAIIDAIGDHLEAHKVPAANALLEALGMDTEPTSSEYSVLVTVSRTITVTQQVELFITADDEDSASDEVSLSALADATGDYWEAEDGSLLCIGSAGRYDIGGYDVDEVNAV